MKSGVISTNRPGVAIRLCLSAFFLCIACVSYATLPPTNNLVMWLNADSLVLANGAGVTSWADSSTNGNDAILHAAWDPAGIPKFYTNGINGRPAVGFGAPGAGGYGSNGNDSLRISNRVAGAFQAIPLPSGFTMAVAIKTFVAGDDDNFAAVPDNYNNLLGDTATAVQFGLASGVASLNTYDNQLTASWIPITGGGALNNTNIYPGHFLIAAHSNNVGALNDRVNLYADGSLVASGNSPYNGATDMFRIGQGNGGGGRAFNGLIGEYLVYNAPLSAADQEQLQLYMTERWLNIPEPSVFALLGTGALLLWNRRRLP